MDFASYQYLFRYSLGKPGALKAYRNAIKNQFLPEEELKIVTWSKTQKLLQYAFDNVPWYTNRFKSMGLNPKDITGPEYFAEVPILTRDELVNNFELFISKKADPKKLKISTTGGSTGTPLKIGMQKMGIRELQKWQLYSWWGLTPGANMATIYRGVPVSGLKKMALNMINWPQRVIRMDATQMTHKKIEEFIALSHKIKPELVHGYVGAVDALADYIIENKIVLPAPKVVWLTAAPVNAIQEEKISNAFHAPVCDQYGCSEIYFIAAECQHKQGLHIFSDSVTVEILNQENGLAASDEYGKIVLTNLEEFHFPLIRYENGDMGRLLNKTCSCGINLPLMDKVKGRISDNIVLPDGTVLAGEYLTTIFDDFTDVVKQFQIIQKKNNSIQVKLVLKRIAERESISKWTKAELGKRIKQQVNLTIDCVDSIDAEKGKLKFIIKE